MIHVLSRALDKFARRWVPDPFALALLLTFLAFVVVSIVTEAPYEKLIGLWGGRLSDGVLLKREVGLWRLLAFTAQMCLILLTGHALASAPAVARWIERVAAKVQTAEQGILLTALIAMLLGALNWGLGLIVGALMAREVGRAAQVKGIKVHYPLLGAAGFTGLLIWHGGLSGTAPLTMTQVSGQIVEGQSLPLSATIFSPLNLIVSLGLLLTVPLLLVKMLPKEEARIPPPQEVEARFEPKPIQNPTPAQRLEHSRLLSGLFAFFALYYLFQYLRIIGLNRLDLNSINLIFLTLGLLLHGSPKRYAEAITEAARGAGGILLQFPLYAGIMGLLLGSGAMDQVAHLIAAQASTATFEPLTFLSAGVVNLFVPSGGGQWAIQGPLVLKAAENLGVPQGQAVMAFAYGDEWTNMLQPFWALPLLSITGLKVRALIGYTATLMLLVAPIYLIGLILL